MTKSENPITTSVSHLTRIFIARPRHLADEIADSFLRAHADRFAYIYEFDLSVSPPTRSMRLSNIDAEELPSGSVLRNGEEQLIAPRLVIVHGFTWPGFTMEFDNPDFIDFRRSLLKAIANPLYTVLVFAESDNDIALLRGAPTTDRWNLTAAEVIPANVSAPSHQPTRSASAIGEGPQFCVRTRGGASDLVAPFLTCPSG
jgi:hypothetical protein